MLRHMCVTSPHVTECDMVVTSSHVKCSLARKQTWGIRWPLCRLKLRWLPLICEKEMPKYFNQSNAVFSKNAKKNTNFSLTYFEVKTYWPANNIFHTICLLFCIHKEGCKSILLLFFIMNATLSGR